MTDWLRVIYDKGILRAPYISVFLCLLITAWLASYIPSLKLDASADSLVLEGDAALDYYRESSQRYSSEEFLLVTYRPDGDLLSDDSLNQLAALRDELKQLSGVSGVQSILDVPLLNSPKIALSEITNADSVQTLSSEGVDRELVRIELQESPIYKGLLTSPDGHTTALQVNLAVDLDYVSLLQQRETLRAKSRNGALTENERGLLRNVEQDFKDYSVLVSERQAALVASARKIIDKYRDGADLFLGGVPMIAVDMISFVQSDLVVFGSGILIFVVIILVIIFRQPRWIVLPLLTCSASALFMLGLLAWLDWRMTVISSNFIALLLIITLAIAIHLIVRFRELEAKSPQSTQRELVLETVILMAKPCLYTSLTTIVAFVSLVVSGIRPVIDFGWMMTVGIVAAFVITFVLLPAVLCLLPKGKSIAIREEGEGLTLIFAGITQRHGGSILIVSLLLLATAGYGISRLEVENRFIDYFHESTEIYRGMEVIDAELGGTIPLEIMIDLKEFVVEPEAVMPVAVSTGSKEAEVVDELSEEFDDDFVDDFSGGFDDEFSDDFGEDDFGSDQPAFKQSYWFSVAGLQRIEAVHNHLDSLPETGKVLSLATMYQVVKDLMGDDVDNVQLALVQSALPDSIKDIMVTPYLSEDIDQARITLRVKETSRELRRDEFLKNLREHLVNEIGFDSEQLHFTGMLVLYNNMLQSLYRSQILTLGAVFVAIMLMFLVLFRSFSLALIAIAPNMLAAGIVLGGMGITGIPLDIMTITIAAIAVGIGVDHAIHYVHRFRREFLQDHNYIATMYRCHASIGKAMYYTSLTVIVGFSILTLSNFNPSIYFGVLTGLAMLASIVGSLLLLPQLIITFKPLGPETKVDA